MHTDTLFNLATAVASDNSFDREVFILRFRDTIELLSSYGTFSSEVIKRYNDLIDVLEKLETFGSDLDIVLLTWSLDYMYQFTCISNHFENRLSKFPIDLSEDDPSFIAVPI
jgi:hypothetical protein